MNKGYIIGQNSNESLKGESMKGYGLIGERLSHSISPKIHELILKEINIKGVYNIYETNRDKLQETLLQLRNDNIKGVNITIPYKISVMEFLDDISKKALQIGSINTITFKGGILKGDNTDYKGFKQTLRSYSIDMSNKAVLILGTGGAAASVFQCAKDENSNNIKLASRSPLRLRDFWKKREAEIISYKEIENFKWDIIINCTPCGMYPDIDSSPISKDALKYCEAVVDLIYNPKETMLLRYSRELGIKGVNGLYMLVAQAIEAQKIWNEIDISQNMTKNVYDKIDKELN